MPDATNYCVGAVQRGRPTKRVNEPIAESPYSILLGEEPGPPGAVKPAYILAEQAGPPIILLPTKRHGVLGFEIAVQGLLNEDCSTRLQLLIK
jgi:hypothetical protein